MAGFDKIKRKLEKFNKDTEQYEIIFDDKLLHSVPYEKCYEDDEIVAYNSDHFYKLIKKLKIKKKGYYRLTVDTLGSYIETTCEYKLTLEPCASMVKSTLF